MNTKLIIFTFYLFVSLPATIRTKSLIVWLYRERQLGYSQDLEAIYSLIIKRLNQMILKLFKQPRLSLLVVMFTAFVFPANAQQSAKKTDSEYINSILPQAQRIEKEYGIPLDLTLAIARQESGNGDYIIGQNNHFGLRCDSDDCITLEKRGQAIEYETCPQASECFNIFAESVNALTGDKPITTQRLYNNGYATSRTWVRRVNTIRREVQQTLSEAGIEY